MSTINTGGHTMTTNTDLDQDREWIDADEVAVIAENISAASHGFPPEYQGKLGTWAKRLRALLPKPRALADTEWDDNVHPYMEAVTVSGRRHVLLAPMGDTEVSENTILVAEHDGGVPVLVPAKYLFPTGRYARLSMPEDHPVFLETEQDYRNAPEGTIVAGDDEMPVVLVDELWRHMGDWTLNHDEMAGIRRRVLRWRCEA